MSNQQLLTKLESFRYRNSENHRYIKKDIYLLLYDRDFYYIAYNNIKSNDGSETLRSDNTSLHGFCEEWIDQLISSFRNYQLFPNRITYIPKKNGKLQNLVFLMGKTKAFKNAFESSWNVFMSQPFRISRMAFIQIIAHVRNEQAHFLRYIISRRFS